MDQFVVLTVYCGLIVAASMLGGALPTMMRLTHTRMQLMMSGVGGLMLGVGTLHLLPHGVAESGLIDLAVGGMFAGILTMFFLMRVFHSHHHAPVEKEYPEVVAEEQATCELEHEHEHKHDHDHHHGGHGHGHCDHDHDAGDPHSVWRWLGIFLGLSLHTLIDGIALAAAVEAAAHVETGFGRLAIGVFLGIVLHKPLDALSITFVMRAGGWSATTMNLINFGYSLMCPIGVVLFYLALGSLDMSWRHYVIGGALGFAAGVFICISLADILPEIQFHSHDKWKLSSALLLGALLAVAIGWLEPPHTQRHQPAPTGGPVTPLALPAPKPAGQQ
ncbi:ZIP family metal transporter [Blastopirellula sp. JC732]|uniref:ZIP family metal transporter n=1 Tax=Blastopirellula sediminis TaxID=2894196 RepID=A0A9X1MNA2_9BACT|nr:ZIP family metal transporter [Blastopirellula sediminis]MCC9606339.1 ZIP family metal transporter [Blastopirellula sediminis]MCC9630363.1 ZIP family metal transporter [Blastopirellula sediminis]